MRRATTLGGLARTSPRAGRRCLSLVAAFALFGCSGGGDGGSAPSGPGPTVQTVTVSPGTQVLTVAGATGQLTATVVRSDGPVVSPTVTWVSQNTSVATISGTGATATVTGVSAGAATITATSGGVSGSATVTVSQSMQALTRDVERLGNRSCGLDTGRYQLPNDVRGFVHVRGQRRPDGDSCRG